MASPDGEDDEAMHAGVAMVRIKEEIGMMPFGEGVAAVADAVVVVIMAVEIIVVAGVKIVGAV